MGKPAKLTYLTEGKALGNPMHKGFCDTFNWLVRFCNNLKGDDTYIEVQNELGDHPLITFGDEVPGRGSGSGSSYAPHPQPFDFQYIETTTTETDPDTGEEVETTTNDPYIVNCVWFLGREYKGLADYAIDTTTSKTYWLKIETDPYGQFSQASILADTYTLPSGAAVPAIP